MAHYGMLREYRFSGDVDDIRGAKLYGTNDDKLGKIDDVIFDHATGTIQYLVVDTGGWLSTKKFLVPADRIYPHGKDEKDFAIDATKQQIEALPPYDEKAFTSGADWSEQDKKYRQPWTTSGSVLHKDGSTHTITPEASEMPAGTGSGVDDSAYTPDRLAGKFPPAEADPSKLRMRPAGAAAKAEDERFPGTSVPAEKPTLAAEEAEDRAAGRPMQAQRDHLTDPENVYAAERARHGRFTAFAPAPEPGGRDS
jgi:sporulation protein YlmC with PRC-barrel domain